MATITQHGGDGRYMVHVDYHGTFLPITSDTPIEKFNEMKTLQVTKDDILICSYPKSGLHWIWEVCTMLRRGTTVPQSDVFMEDLSLDWQTLQPLASRRTPRVFVTHLHYKDIPDSFKEHQCKIIYLSRDPRAVVVSFWHHIYSIKDTCTLNLQEFVEYFLQGKVMFNGWKEHITAWDKAIQEKSDVHQFLTLCFEDAKEDPLAMVLRLNEFLGAGMSTARCEDIVQNTKIANLRKFKTETENNPYSYAYIDGTYPVYRKGTVDSWKNCLTVAQNEKFQQAYNSLSKNCIHVKIRNML